MTETVTYDKIIDASLEKYMHSENRKMMMHAAAVVCIGIGLKAKAPSILFNFFSNFF